MLCNQEVLVKSTGGLLKSTASAAALKQTSLDVTWHLKQEEALALLTAA